MKPPREITVTVDRRADDEEEPEPVAPGGRGWVLTGSLQEPSAAGGSFVLRTWERSADDDDEPVTVRAPAAPAEPVNDPLPAVTRADALSRLTPEVIAAIRAAHSSTRPAPIVPETGQTVPIVPELG